MSEQKPLFEEGQRVAMTWDHWGRTIERLTNVSRVTPTLALIGMMKFNRSTGHVHGDRYSKQAIEPVTPEILAEFNAQNAKNARIRYLGKFLDGNWRSMGDDNLEKVANVLGFVPPEVEL